VTPEDATDGETDADPRRPPASLRAVADGLSTGVETTHRFEDEWVDVPARFDGPSRTARWRFDGSVTVRVEEEGEPPE
jgi:hypothetical protein